VPARVVCISYEIGAGGREVGRLVAERLGFHYVNEEIIAEAAEKGGVVPEALVDVEARKSLTDKIVEQLFWAGMIASTPNFSPAEFTGEPYRRLIMDVVRATAERGEVVIVAHAAGMALAGQPGVLRASVTAPQEFRARRLAESDGLELRAATKVIRDGDLDRASYFKRFYDVPRELPTHYDLVVNTEALEADHAAALIVQAAGYLGQAEAPAEAEKAADTIV